MAFQSCSWVGARLIYSTILPRDEQRFFGNVPQILDGPERQLIEGLQGMVVANAQVRAYHRFMKKEIKGWRRNRKRWDADARLLRTHNRQLEREVEELRSQLLEARSGSSTLREEVQDLQQAKENCQRELDELRTTNKALLLKNFIRTTELASSRAWEFTLQKQLGVSEQRLEDNRSAIRAKAVREYRLSKDCYDRKERYAICFMKYGFYLARSFLESQRPGEMFPELTFTPEVQDFEVPDWRRYDPDPTSPSTFLDSQLEDDLENLMGPWEPYSQDLRRGE